MRIRRVVTGQAQDGTFVFVDDHAVAPITLDLLPGVEFHRIWGADKAVRLPTDDSVPATPGYFPPAGGFRFGFFTLGPDTRTIREDLDVGAALAELAEKLPGMAEVIEAFRKL